jgi:hypothetical protein
LEELNMKKFADILADTIIEREDERVNAILTEVTTKIRDDFVREVYRLVDEYYDNYTPARYVRLYEPKRKLRKKRGTKKAKAKGTSKASLYEAITKGGYEDPIIGVSGKIDGEWVGGVIFDPSKIGYRTGMRHPDRGISEWNIVENFIFAGDAKTHDLTGDWRSVSASGYNYPSADEELNMYMTFYKPILDQHYKDAYNNNTK